MSRRMHAIGRESIRVTRSVSIPLDGDRDPRLALERPGRPARQHGGDARRGALRRRGVVGADGRSEATRRSSGRAPSCGRSRRTSAARRGTASSRSSGSSRTLAAGTPTSSGGASRPRPTRAARERRLEEKRQRARSSAAAAPAEDEGTPGADARRARPDRPARVDSVPYRRASPCESTQDLLRGVDVCRRARSRRRAPDGGPGPARVGPWEDAPGWSLLVSVLLRPERRGRAPAALARGRARRGGGGRGGDRPAGDGSSGRTTSCSPTARSPGSCSRRRRRGRRAASGSTSTRTRRRCRRGRAARRVACA